MFLYNRTDYRGFIRAPARLLLVDGFDLMFTLAMLRDAIDNRPYPLARDARVQRRHGAYHESFEIHYRMVPQVREVLHRPIVLNTPVTLDSNTLEAVKGMFFVEGIY